ncbi:MAG: hypothetical protein EOO29_22200 [Comamonadaceae bacterium]|nr:MAG: hypothetical protein EOO29_22200 [Comamonadaceae bacterium]
MFAQQFEEGAFGQQLDIFRKHAEQTARQKGRHVVGAVARGFERFGEFGQLRGHLSRDARADAAGVKRVRVGPHQPQAFAQLGFGQIGQRDPVAARVREGRVGGAAAREVGIQLDDVADVDHAEEGHTALGGGQGTRVGLRLRMGAEHRGVEAVGARLHLAQLLAFPHEVALAVAVDAACRVAAIGECSLSGRSNM